MVYLFIKDMDMADRLDISIGEALFTGLITDTGSFRYSTRGLTYQIAGELKNMGVDDYAFPIPYLMHWNPKPKITGSLFG